MPLRWTKTVDGHKAANENGTAEIFRTVQPDPLTWTLEINGTYHNKYLTDAEAITDAEEILALPNSRR